MRVHSYACRKQQAGACQEYVLLILLAGACVAGSLGLFAVRIWGLADFKEFLTFFYRVFEKLKKSVSILILKGTPGCPL